MKLLLTILLIASCTVLDPSPFLYVQRDGKYLSYSTKWKEGAPVITTAWTSDKASAHRFGAVDSATVAAEEHLGEVVR